MCAVWIVLLTLGALTYTTFIKREGFPPIQFPLTLINATYFVDDADRVDSEVVQPLYELTKTIEGVESVQSSANANVTQIAVFFDSDTTPELAFERVSRALDQAQNIPEQASITPISIDPSKFLNQYDLILSVYVESGADNTELQAAASELAAVFNNHPDIREAEVQPLLANSVDPENGNTTERQVSFSSIGIKQGDAIRFFQAINIGVNKVDTIDAIDLSNISKDLVAAYNADTKDFAAAIGADVADTISTQISSLQSNLLGGLLAVAIVSLLLITWRASVITALFMITVVLVTILVLWVIGFTLNTITLFGLVLALGLFVDDATIVVEAIDGSRRKNAKGATTIKNAIKRVATASFAGTMTTVLVFLPLAFVGGVLGEFIRLLPITVIIALISSLVLSLTLIPFLSRGILLNAKTSSISRYNIVGRVEAWCGHLLSDWIHELHTKHRNRAMLRSLSFIVLSLLFVGGGGYFATRLSFNIFPPTKDSNQLGFQINYAEGTNIQEAEAVAQDVNKIVSSALGQNIERVIYGSTARSTERSSNALIELTPFTTRDTKSPELLESLQGALDMGISRDIATIRVIQFDSGPPVEEYPFKMQLYTESPQDILALASDIEELLKSQPLQRNDGSTANITETQVANINTVARDDGRRFIEVRALYDADDTSALLALTQEYLEATLTAEYLADTPLNPDDISYDFGQESENAESFSSLVIVFPIALLLMYLLLAVQFKSLAQPLLIFLAIPFSLFGVFGGLYFTNNAISFFAQVGLIGLIGIAVNNAILLTDYANQERRTGKSAVESIATATKLRFRPLLATSVTTVVALLPLALTDPFWEPLAYTIIFGLLSSTFLVMLAFPYYYLLLESLRSRTSRRQALLWIFGLVVGVIVVVSVNASLLLFVGAYILASIAFKNYWSKV